MRRAQQGRYAPSESSALEIPGRGAFVADNPDVYKAIEEAADLHLGFAKPRREFSKATDAMDRALRERIHVTANEVQSIPSDPSLLLCRARLRHNPIAIRLALVEQDSSHEGWAEPVLN